jgi:hypothetical protein
VIRILIGVGWFLGRKYWPHLLGLFIVSGIFFKPTNGNPDQKPEPGMADKVLSGVDWLNSKMDSLSDKLREDMMRRRYKNSDK